MSALSRSLCCSYETILLQIEETGSGKESSTMVVVIMPPGAVTGTISMSSTGTRITITVTGGIWMPTVLEATDLITCPERDRMSSTAATETTGDTETIMTGTIMTPSGGGQMILGPRITISRISGECLTTDPLWVTTARDPQTITALSTQTSWGNINSPCPHCTLQSQILAHPLPRNLPMTPNHPWITDLLWRDH